MAMNQASSGAFGSVQPGTRKDAGRFFKMLLASVLFHAVLTPFPAMLGLIAMLPALKLSDDSEIVEIELTSLPIAPRAEDPKPTETPTAEPVAPPEPPPSEPDQPEVADAPKPQEDPPEEKKTEQTAPAEESERVAPNELYSDPMALAGDAGEVADSNANVRLFIFADVIRKQPLGARVGELLKRTPQWSDFFGTADIDPIRDVDRVLIAGPQLRNSSQVVAVVQHHLPKPMIDGAFAQLVQRKGEWIDREGRIARAQADRASRIFAAPNDSVVVVAPPQMEAQLRALGKESKFARADGDIALSAYLVTPHRVAKGTGLELPKSVKWARFDLRPTADGGGILKILAQDEDAEHAQANAQFFQVLIDQVASIDLKRGGGLGAMASFLLGSQKVRMLKEASFRANKDKIEGTVIATAAQLMNIADLLDAFLPPSSPGIDSVHGAAKQVGAGKETTTGVRNESTTDPSEAVPMQPAAPRESSDSLPDTGREDRENGPTPVPSSMPNDQGAQGAPVPQGE